MDAMDTNLHRRTTRFVALSLYCLNKHLIRSDRTGSVPDNLRYINIGHGDGVKCTIVAGARGVELTLFPHDLQLNYPCRLSADLTLESLEEHPAVQRLVEIVMSDWVNLMNFVDQVTRLQAYLCWLDHAPDLADMDPFHLVEHLVQQQYQEPNSGGLTGEAGVADR